MENVTSSKSDLDLYFSFFVEKDTLWFPQWKHQVLN